MPFHRLVPLLLGVALAGGCGGAGGGGSSGPADTTPPTVTSTVPASGAGGIATSATLTASFSEAMDPSSLSAATFLVADGVSSVAGSVSRGPSSVTFTPSSPLSAGTTYSATVTTGATDAAGNAMAASHTWSFTTAAAPPPPRGWGAQATIGAARNTFDVEIHGVDVDLNEGGAGIAVWEEAGDASGSVWVAWYRGSAWEPAVRLTDASLAAVLPRAALNDAGTAIVAYEVIGYDAVGWPASRTVWARRFVDGAWAAAERVSDAPSAPGQLYAWRPRAGIDAQGRALVAWNQGADVMGARFDGAGWGAPFLVSGGDAYASWADAAVSADGSAVVVWSQDTKPFDPGQSGGGPTIPNVWARSFDGAGWGSPQRIGNSDLADYEGCERAAVVMDGAGRAFAIWEEHRGEGNRIVSARLDPAVPAWSAPAVLAASSAPTDHLSFPSIAAGGGGSAFAVWRPDVPGEPVSHGAAARLDAALGAWAGAELFETGGDVVAAVAAMDGAAGGWALSSQAGMKARRLDPGLGWQVGSPLGPGTVTDADANGQGMVLVGGYSAYYSSSPLGFFVSARASVFVP
jgi:hypothetical protein